MKQHPNPNPNSSQTPGIEHVKGLNMVDFLSRHYGLNFSVHGGPGGGQPRCLSPFKEERKGSFFVREVDGHWLFKDFSSGYGGSLIDFVLLKERLSTVPEALRHIGSLLSGGNVGNVGNGNPNTGGKGYDIEGLYHKFQGNDVSRCRDYLLSRGIDDAVINHLCEHDLLVHNMYEGNSYCCFAVFDPAGQLRCLDNHRIEGDGKFVLGSKHPFSLDWQELPTSERVFVTEGIIDYLSMKTLEGFSFGGLALLGSVINFSSSLFASASEIVSALDGDNSGFSAFLDLEESFSDRVVRVYDFGESKDANEYLQNQEKRKKVKNLSPQDKLLLYQDYQRGDNKSQVARKWGVNRSYMYEVVKECEELILSGFSQRRRGRKSANKPETLADACERIESLEQENRRLDEEKERYYVRNEFMKVRLKWAQQEASEPELCGDSGDSDVAIQTDDEHEPQRQLQLHPSGISKNRKRHLKKKRKRKP